MNAYWFDHQQFLLAVRQLVSNHNQIRMTQVWNLHDTMRCSMLMCWSVSTATPHTCFSHTSVLESGSRPWEDRSALHCAYLQVISVLDVGLRGCSGQVGEVGGMLYHQRNSLPAVTQTHQSLCCIIHFLNRTKGREGQTVFTEQQVWLGNTFLVDTVALRWKDNHNFLPSNNKQTKQKTQKNKINTQI